MTEELVVLTGNRFSNVAVPGSGVQLPGGSPAICALSGLTLARPTALHASTILKVGPAPGMSVGTLAGFVLMLDWRTNSTAANQNSLSFIIGPPTAPPGFTTCRLLSAPVPVGE